jgi:GNAT superfamily N-acetyltransferase
VTSYREPVRLSPEHDVSGFRCGRQPLDDWLKRYSLINQHAGMTTTFVATADDANEVVGFYSLATGGVDHPDAPARVRKGVPRHPIPVIVLARLAVHEGHQGQRLGRGLLRDALVRVSNAADEIGVRALLIHAKDEQARDFYLAQAEFEPSPIDPLQLFLLLKDLRKSVSQ